MKNRKEEMTIKELEDLITGSFPESYAESFFEGMGEGLNEVQAAKYAMAAHRGDN